VVREVVPVLHEIGDEQEQAARHLGAGPCNVPAVNPAGDSLGGRYGVVLSTAQALGEFGAVSVVSGRITGQTETLRSTSGGRSPTSTKPAPTRASLVLALSR